MSAATSAAAERAWEVLAGVADPEIPAVSVVDLGIVREIRAEGAALEVTVTPTYSGCPATQVIRYFIRELHAIGLVRVENHAVFGARVVLGHRAEYTGIAKDVSGHVRGQFHQDSQQ